MDVRNICTLTFKMILHTDLKLPTQKGEGGAEGDCVTTEKKNWCVCVCVYTSNAVQLDAAGL